jgi:monofunctional biosynthetic peptidoglycan transglycosylase
MIMAYSARTLPRRILVLLAKTIFWFVALTVLWVLAYRFVAPPITLTMALDEHGASREWLNLDEIDRTMAIAVIAAEDSNFCIHDGFDFEAIQQAWDDRQAGRRFRGASTISQQTAKNVFLWQGGGWLRKGLETYFTFLIENLWGKQRIMEVYLNVAETGIGTYGANAGSMRYFDHDASQMNDSEAARIAAILPSPQSRAARNPSGWTARYGRTIAARMRQVRASPLDYCI